MTIRTRFAPSPTGYLHIGGVRTALYSWLYARKHGGQFILRIEDTDRERSTEESVQAILDGMAWLGLSPDEGPFYQTHHFDRYKEVIQQLLDAGKAYHCYCSQERLEKLRAEQMEKKLKPRYDGHCRHLKTPPAGVKPVVRFLNPATGDVTFKDLIKGTIRVSNEELDDLIIARSDGTPTYNLTVVVDDMDMQITHVIRGDDHVNNTPRQINILQALGAKLPEYAHAPMILGDDGQRLSKRHGAVSVLQYQEDGFLPQAVLNYLVRLGWSHGDQEIFSLVEMQSLFDVSNVNRAPSAFNTEKLLWLNQHYIKTMPIDELVEPLATQFKLLGIDATQGPPLADAIALFRERASTLQEMAENSRFLYNDIDNYDEKLIKKHFKPNVLEALETIYARLSAEETWTPEFIHDVVNAVVTEYELKFPKLGQPLRLAATGGGASPSIDVTLHTLGRVRSLQRLRQALDSARQLTG